MSQQWRAIKAEQTTTIYYNQTPISNDSPRKLVNKNVCRIHETTHKEDELDTITKMQFKRTTSNIYIDSSRVFIKENTRR